MNKTSKRRSLKTELSNKLRGEQDGGKIMQSHTSIADRHFLLQPLQTNTAMHDTLFQWSEKFVIEPFQPGVGIGWTRKNPPNEK